MNHVMVIAEAGVNHNGDLETAKKLVDVAYYAKADAVKFQCFNTKKLVVPSLKKAGYQLEHTNETHSQFEMLKELELSKEQLTELYAYCESRNIMFLCSAFEEESLTFLDSLGIGMLKIPSGEITNYPYLKQIAAMSQDVILSTGMSSIEEIKAALNVLESTNPDRNITLLHCISAYPTKVAEANLKVIITLKEEFKKQTGFSDHTIGMEASIAAVTLGACVIEKHITLEKEMEGPDHQASMEPEEFACFVRTIREIEKGLGDGRKMVSKEELENQKFVRKCLVAAKSIKEGELFTENNICAKRAGIGISPMRINEILGTAAKKEYEEDETIEE